MLSDDDLLLAALAEDLGTRGDITTALTVGARAPAARGRIVAKASGRLSGVALGRRVFQLLDDAVAVTVHAPDGSAVGPGDLVLEVVGSAATMLSAERTALNVMQQLSGVATMTARFVALVEGTAARIVDTRKTTACWRMAQKAAVVHGGGHNHRIGLYDQILIKENHFAMAGGDFRAVVAAARREEPGLVLIAEAETLEQARAIADGGADVILLDDFGLKGLGEAVRALAEHPRRQDFELEASGGVDLDTVADVAATGVDRISVGYLTHSSPALDLSMLIEPDAVP